MPKGATALVDISFDAEIYDGFWNQNGQHISDPPGSDLRQYRLNTGVGVRLARDWQSSVVVPYVWNENKYAASSSSSDGLGDTTLALWYEMLEDRSAWKLNSLSNLVPTVNLGLSLLLPTGKSPYDDEKSSFDVTGRGFYRLDGNLYIDKMYRQWDTTVQVSYGTYFERSVNREYGKYVEPYDKQLGDRFFSSFSLGYNYYFGSGGDTLTGTASYSYLHEDEGTINGHSDSSSKFRKQSVGGTLAYSSTDHDWSMRIGWNHAIQADGWGANFPTTDIYTVGVRYVFR